MWVIGMEIKNKQTKIRRQKTRCCCHYMDEAPEARRQRLPQHHRKVSGLSLPSRRERGCEGPADGTASSRRKLGWSQG